MYYRGLHTQKSEPRYVDLEPNPNRGTDQVNILTQIRKKITE